MKRSRVVVTLEMRDLLELEEVCLDEDAEAALRFLKKRVKPQVDAAQVAGCDPQFHLKGNLEGQVAKATGVKHPGRRPAPPATG